MVHNSASACARCSAEIGQNRNWKKGNFSFQFLAQRIEQAVAMGKTPNEAHYEALKAMEGIEQREVRNCRDARQVSVARRSSQRYLRISEDQPA